jgi:hypothetical protein
MQMGADFSKRLQTTALPSMAVYLHFPLWVLFQVIPKEGEMNQDVQMRTAGCPDYQRLLQECQNALIAWKNRSEEITHFGLQGKAAGDGLQRLQAEYARAYNRLKRHADGCRACCFHADLAKGERTNLVGSSQSKELLA